MWSKTDRQPSSSAIRSWLGSTMRKPNHQPMRESEGGRFGVSPFRRGSHVERRYSSIVPLASVIYSQMQQEAGVWDRSGPYVFYHYPQG
ncbi:hypothetical protein BHE74_00006703 [Ensete ventricosum]|nr:hypothetical protein BHE74_00006703 [Ensete ventricosum]